MEEKKNKKGLGPGFMVILVVLFLVGGVLGFAASKILDEPVKKDNTEEKEKKEAKKEDVKEEELDVNSEQVTTLFQNITTGNTKYCGFYGFFTDKKMTINDLDLETQEQIMLSKLYKDLYNAENSVTTGKTYTKEEVEKVYKQLFGKDYKVKHESIKSCPSFSYDEGTGKYTIGDHNCGGTCGPYATSGEVVKAVKKGEIIVLDIKILFSDGNAFYTDYAKTQKVEVEADEYGNPNSLSVRKEKGTSYKATFKLEDGNYVFVSVEPVK